MTEIEEDKQQMSLHIFIFTALLCLEMHLNIPFSAQPTGFTFIQTTETHSVDVCNKRGVSFAHYMLFSRPSHEEVEEVVILPTAVNGGGVLTAFVVASKLVFF